MEFHTPMEALTVLGLDQNATKEDIKTAYHKMAAYYHPDAHAAGEAETTESFLVIRQAYEYLMDAYEKALAAYLAGQQRGMGQSAGLQRNMDGSAGNAAGRQAAGWEQGLSDTGEVSRVLGSKTAILRQETNRNFAEQRVKQEKRLKKEREAKRRKVEEELASYKADAAYEEAMAKIHAIRAAEITAHIIETVVLGQGSV